MMSTDFKISTKDLPLSTFTFAQEVGSPVFDAVAALSPKPVGDHTAALTTKAAIVPAAASTIVQEIAAKTSTSEDVSSSTSLLASFTTNATAATIPNPFRQGSEWISSVNGSILIFSAADDNGLMTGSIDVESGNVYPSGHTDTIRGRIEVSPADTSSIALSFSSLWSAASNPSLTSWNGLLTLDSATSTGLIEATWANKRQLAQGQDQFTFVRNNPNA